MNALHLLTGPMAQAIGWALLHLLWQATIVAGILAAVLALMSRQTASARYVVSCGALALVFSMFVATAIRAYDPAAAPIAVSPDEAQGEIVQISLTQLPVLIAQSAAEGLKDRAIRALSSARAALPSIVAIWLAGVVLLSARLMVSWIRARRLVHRDAVPAAAELQLTAIRLADALGLRAAVKLLQSAAVEVPSVIGTLRPVILIPASALTGMTPEQIEMVLAHELAHIRRHDFLVNLLQAVVETLMFYHPAVWWMSRRVRIERENCCDDMAVAVCGNPLQYARALTRLEELRANTLPVVVAANGGSLLERIRRIAAGSNEGPAANSRWAAALVMLVVVVMAIAVPTLPALADRDKEKKEAKAEEAAQVATAQIDVLSAGDPAPEADRDDEADEDSDYELYVDAPDAPDAPDTPEVPPVPVIAPMAFVPPVPMTPMIAPVPRPFPVPAVHPVPPTPPVARAMAFADMSRDFDFDFDYDYEHGGSDDSRAIGEGGKLTVDELISLRAVGVTPDYVNQMRALFPGLTLKGVTSMKAVGVTPEFIKEMRASGFTVTSAKDATGLAAVGVTAEWVREMKAAGVTIGSAKEAQSMKAVGVTADFVRRLAKAGYANLTARELTRMAASGVDDDFIRDMEQYRKKN
ncbi:MAG TPA: M56 family metallopeptidase [Thermoanaerobaculia bacterium]|nr:M56 family metallopeptidase [Thermoanaerobaculia bacterium]